MRNNRKTLTKAARPRTAAATARPLSNIVIPAAEEAAARRDGARGAAAAAADGGATPTGLDAGGAGAAGAEAAPDTGAAAAAAVGVATGAGVGILIVGAAVGLGGRLIRTVSFFGCTLAASAGFRGPGASGVFGVFSAIKLPRQTRNRLPECQTLFGHAIRTAPRRHR